MYQSKERQTVNATCNFKYLSRGLHSSLICSCVVQMISPARVADRRPQQSWNGALLVRSKEKIQFPRV